MKNGHALHYALLGMVSSNPSGIHGYALKRQCDRLLGSFWCHNFGEIYRILDRLSAEKSIEQIVEQPESHRKIYRITDKGRRSLDTFILTPPTDAPRPLRQELAVKLLFASRERVPELVQLVQHQRDAYLRQLHLLGVQRRKLARAPVDAFVTNLLIDGAELSARAELSWLDDVTRKLQQRFQAQPQNG